MAESEKYKQFKQTIVDALVSVGWSGPGPRYVNPLFVASKDFETLAGPNNAAVRFIHSFEYVGTLSGEYYAEGRNVLTTTTFHAGFFMSLDEVAEGAKAFAAEVEQVISQTRMVRAMNISKDG